MGIIRIVISSMPTSIRLSQHFGVLFMRLGVKLVHFEHQLDHSEQSNHSQAYTQHKLDCLMLLFYPCVFHALALLLFEVKAKTIAIIGGCVSAFACIMSLPPQILFLQFGLLFGIGIAITVAGGWIISPATSGSPLGLDVVVELPTLHHQLHTFYGSFSVWYASFIDLNFYAKDGSWSGWNFWANS